MTDHDIIFQFIERFNDIDKHFDSLINNNDNIDGFLPFNDKIKKISQSKQAISRYVDYHSALLKYFGELRNHLIHGLHDLGHTYTNPTSYAIDKITHIRDHIVRPAVCQDLFIKDVYQVDEHAPLMNVIHTMYQTGYNHVPVFRTQGEWLGILNHRMITHRLATQKKPSLTLSGLSIDDVHLDRTSYKWIQPHMTIHEVYQLFFGDSMHIHHAHYNALYITATGHPSTEILGVITASDIAKYAYTLFDNHL